MGTNRCRSRSITKQAATLAGTQGKGIGAFEDYLTAGAAYTGPDAYKQFMSPYQQQVIDATMTSFDKQAAMQRRGISDRAVHSSELLVEQDMGIAGSEYDAASDMNRALNGITIIYNKAMAKLRQEHRQHLDNNKD